MKKKHITVLLAAASLAMVSCENFLEQDSPSTILANTYFTNESSLETYANGLLNAYTPSYTTLTYGDQDADYVARTNQSNFYTGSWSPNEQDGWDTGDWKMLYDVNYFLKHMGEADVDERTLQHYQGVARFWRAWFYYAKVRTFGGVPWYDEPIDAEDQEALYKGRDSREYVMHRILEDLNFAATYCSTESKYVNCGVINGYIAQAFKARVCLFEGTYRKYHKNNPETQGPWSTEYESAEDFLRAAVTASEALMTNSPYQLVDNPANVATQYHMLFNQEKINYTEILWAREYSASLPLLHETTWKFNSSTNGNCWSMNKQFLNTYLMLDGSRYTDQPGYATKSYVDELTGRDYRLQQTIITPAYKKKQNGVEAEYTPNFSITRTGYQVIKWNIDDDAYELSAQSYNSLPIFRFAEVLLNYAEAKAELEEFGQTEWDATIAKLRARAGVATDAPATADPYLIQYFDNTVDDKWLLEIRRERGIELFMENLRYDDLMRWKLGHLIVRPWTGIYAPLGQKQPLNAARTKFICVMQDREGTEIGTEYIVLAQNPSLSLQNNLLTFRPLERKWTDRMYLRPIPQAARDVNGNLAQNPEW